MEPFSLEKYLADPTRKVVTMDGYPVRIICTDRKMENYPIIALMNINGEEELYSYRASGVYRYDIVPNEKDLFFAPQTQSRWVFLFRKTNGAVDVSYIHDNKSDAEDDMKRSRGFALTEITWEE